MVDESRPERDRSKSRELAGLWQQIREQERADDEYTGREVFEYWEKAFGEKVRQWRRARDWSQDFLAEQMSDLGFEMHQTTVAKIERGARPLRVSEAVALSTIFDVPALAVFQGPGPEQEPFSLAQMRDSLEKTESALSRAQDLLAEQARTVAWWEKERVALADDLRRASLESDLGNAAEE